MNGSTRFQLSPLALQRNDCQGNGLDENLMGKEDPAELLEHFGVADWKLRCRIMGRGNPTVKYPYSTIRLAKKMRGKKWCKKWTRKRKGKRVKSRSREAEKETGHWGGNV